MAKSKTFWAKIGAGLVAIGLGLGLMLANKMSVDNGIKLILQGIETLQTTQDQDTKEILQAPEPPPVDRRDEVAEPVLGGSQ